MEKFYYFLKENPNYPEVIMANNKKEVVSLLINDMGEHARDYILKILSEEEFTGKKSVNVNNVNLNGASEDFVKNAFSALSNSNVNQVSNESPKQPTLNSVASEIKYFSAGGENFKLENGILYKKIWKEVENSEDFRIIKSDTLKPIKSEKYKIETLIWDKAD